MPAEREIRADYNTDTLVVYQAYSPAIALPSLAAQRFVPPFSFGRMTWIKPSFLWLMERSNWAQKAGQEHILAVRITRAGWEEALSLGILTDADPHVYPSYADWEAQFQQAQVHIQWDPERSLRGSSLPYGSIQVGLSRHIIRRYAEEWTVAMEDYTPRVKKMATLLRTGKEAQARAHLPSERIYPLFPALKQRLGAT
ncbi:MAG TPA: DUF4291 domain-containing protein [Chthonomonadaceae bacterium]|nr:DUF4291 domain-containing protein [Chthonomonadaceae bacterium]